MRGPQGQREGPAEEQTGLPGGLAREKERDQVVDGEDGRPANPVRHQVIGAMIKVGAQTGQQAGDSPLLAGGKGGAGEVHDADPLPRQGGQVPGRGPGGVAQEDQTLSRTQPRGHRPRQVDDVSANAGEVTGGGAGV
jgi:hypothetical protein